MDNAAGDEKTDVFLTHAWKEDELDRNTHARVSTINKQLRGRGYKTWFDEQKMEGDTRVQMQKGIDNTNLVMVFLTKTYRDKLDCVNPNDNVKLEYNYAFNKNKPILYIAFEPFMTDHGNWDGQLLMTSMNALYVCVDKDFDDEAYLKERVKELVSQLKRKGIKPSKAMGRQCSGCNDILEEGKFCRECGILLVTPPCTPADERESFFNDEKESQLELIRCENIETQPTTCRFIGNGDKFVTLNNSGVLQVWDTNTLDLVKQSDEEGFADIGKGISTNSSKVVTKGPAVGSAGILLEVYPNGSYIVVCSKNVLHWLDSQELQIKATYDVTIDDIEQVNNFKISSNGLICVVGTEKKGFVCYDISNINKVKKTSITYGPKGSTKALDLHRNDEFAVCSYYEEEGFSFVIDTWDITTGKQIKRLNGDKVSHHVKCVQNTDQILYVVDGMVHLVDKEGEVISSTFDSKIAPHDEVVQDPVTVVPSKSNVVIAGADKSLVVYDIASGNRLQSFPGDFIVLDSHPSKWIVLALGVNKSVYVLQHSHCMHGNMNMI